MDGGTRSAPGVEPAPVIGDGAAGFPPTAERAAIGRVARLAAEGRPTEVLFEAVTAEAAALTGALAAMGKFEEDRTSVGVVARTDGALPLGFRYAIHGNIISARVARSGRPERIDDYAELVGAEFVRDHGHRAGVAVPVFVGGRLWGLLAVASTTGPLAARTEERLSVFAEIVAAAIAGAEARDHLRALADEQAALLRVAALVARGASESDIFKAVATEAAGLVDEEATTLVRYEGDRTFVVLAEHNGPAQAGLEVRVPEEDAGALDQIMRTLKPVRLDHHRTIRSFSWETFEVGSSVSIPIIVEGRLWGALGTLNEGRRLPAETEERLAKFAELISAAIANVQARTQLQRYGQEQASRRRVAELVARSAGLEEVFDAVAFEASTVLGGLPANLAQYDAEFTTCTAVSQYGGAVRVGLQVHLDHEAPTLPMIRERKPIRIPTFTGTPREDDAHNLGVDAMVAVPVIVEDRVWGVLSTVTSGYAPPPDTEERLVELAELAAVAIANAENREKLKASRARVVATADETRHRLQRDVHDGAQQRLVQTVLTLRLALSAVDRGEDAVGFVEEALQHAQRATAELRDVVHGILPASVTRGGLRAGLESLLDDQKVPVRLDMTRYPLDRPPADIEVTAYFVINEALTNVVKHAQASSAHVTVAVDDGTLTVMVSDDGIGGAAFEGGSGLVGLTDRVEAMNGSLVVSSPVGRGTTLHVTLPVPASTAPPPPDPTPTGRPRHEGEPAGTPDGGHGSG